MTPLSSNKPNSRADYCTKRNGAPRMSSPLLLGTATSPSVFTFPRRRAPIDNNWISLNECPVISKQTAEASTATWNSACKTCERCCFVKIKARDTGDTIYWTPRVTRFLKLQQYNLMIKIWDLRSHLECLFRNHMMLGGQPFSIDSCLFLLIATLIDGSIIKRCATFSLAHFNALSNSAFKIGRQKTAYCVCGVNTTFNEFQTLISFILLACSKFKMEF